MNNTHKWNYVLCEIFIKLMLFCFICGKLGHGESFYLARILQDNQDLTFGWDISLKAPLRRATIPSNRWLREDEGGSPN